MMPGICAILAVLIIAVRGTVLHIQTDDSPFTCTSSPCLLSAVHIAYIQDGDNVHVIATSLIVPAARRLYFTIPFDTQQCDTVPLARLTVSRVYTGVLCITPVAARVSDPLPQE